MRPNWLQTYSFIPIIACVLLLTSCSLFGGDQTNNSPTPVATVNAHPTTDSAILDMLNNMKQNGFNSDSTINDGMGGLYINWRYGTNPLETNINGTGET